MVFKSTIKRSICNTNKIESQLQGCGVSNEIILNQQDPGRLPTADLRLRPEQTLYLNIICC